MQQIGFTIELFRLLKNLVCAGISNDVSGFERAPLCSTSWYSTVCTVPYEIPTRGMTKERAAIMYCKAVDLNTIRNRVLDCPVYLVPLSPLHHSSEAGHGEACIPHQAQLAASVA
jgi:hypothetical protein